VPTAGWGERAVGLSTADEVVSAVRSMPTWSSEEAASGLYSAVAECCHHINVQPKQSVLSRLDQLAGLKRAEAHLLGSPLASRRD